MRKQCEEVEPMDRVRHLISLLKCASKNLCSHSVQCTEKHIENLHQETKGTPLVNGD